MPLPEPLVSPLLQAAGFRHGFFTREGGVSTGAYASLNFSAAAGDDEANVAENRARAARVLEVPEPALLYLSQVHGVIVIEAKAGDEHPSVVRREGDAIASIEPKLACGVRTADCVPVLIGDRASGAVAAVHAGWRGAVSGVIEAAVALLRERFDARDLVAAIGPHIETSAFEIGDEVALEIERAAKVPGVIVRSPQAKPHANLRLFCRGALARVGVTAIDDVAGCTVGDPARFFSYRRDGARSGRLLSAIAARGR